MERNLVRRKTKNQPGLVSGVASIQKMLATLRWDGVDRLSAYVGLDRSHVSPDIQHQRQQARKWLNGLLKHKERQMSVIIYGPQGCGKTTHAKALMKHFGLNHLIDDGEDENGNLWCPGDPVPDDTLVLTGAPGIDGALDFFEVKDAMDAALVSE